MKMTARLALAIIATLIIGALVRIDAQQNETISDKDIKVIKFEELRYPQLARTAHVEGVVVVRVQLDDQGGVMKATAISGADVLVRDCLANAKKWKFEPNARKMAVIVYSFTLPPAYCGSVASFFMLRGVNFATVTACPPTVETTR